jgi:hypothetical protein
MTILEAMDDPNLFGLWFSGKTWTAWFAFLAALFGLPTTKKQATLFPNFTNRSELPKKPAKEVWMVRRQAWRKKPHSSSRSRFLACFKDYSQYLAPGERGTLMVIAADRRQARAVMQYIKGFLEIPMLAAMAASERKEIVELSNRITMEIHTARFRSTRGYTLIGCVADKIAFWRSEDSADTDVEILAGVRPGMASIPGALLLCISSPYARRGALWEAYRNHFGKDGDPVLVWQADNRSMNPLVDPQIIRDAYI